MIYMHMDSIDELLQKIINERIETLKEWPKSP
jgi:hypothetical protein